MSKKPSDPSRHTPPAGQRPVDNERTNARTGKGDHGNEKGQPSLEGGHEAEAIEQPGRGGKSGGKQG